MAQQGLSEPDPPPLNAGFHSGARKPQAFRRRGPGDALNFRQHDGVPEMRRQPLDKRQQAARDFSFCGSGPVRRLGGGGVVLAFDLRQGLEFLCAAPVMIRDGVGCHPGGPGHWIGGVFEAVSMLHEPQHHVTDNLTSRKGKAVRLAIRKAGAKLFFLPEYSPDLNPIEQVFAKLRSCSKSTAANMCSAGSGRAYRTRVHQADGRGAVRRTHGPGRRDSRRVLYPRTAAGPTVWTSRA